MGMTLERKIGPSGSNPNGYDLYHLTFDYAGGLIPPGRGPYIVFNADLTVQRLNRSWPEWLIIQGKLLAK